MADVLALEHIFNEVQALFVRDSVAATQFFGWRKPAELVRTFPRITWTPGRDGDLGAVTGARDPGRNPRPLGTLNELCTVEISAFDETDPNDELLQYRAARFLFDEWYRAVYLTLRGAFQIESARWRHDKKQLGAGACIQVVISVGATLPSTKRATTTTPATAELTAEELGHTETLNAGGPQE